MCDKCVELRAKIEQILGDKITDSEFTGVKVIAALGADIETIVEAVKTRRNPEKEELSETTKAAIDEVVEALASAFRNGGMASPGDVSKILGRKMTEIEETRGYKMAKEGKSAEEIAAALQGETHQAVKAGSDAEADLPDDIKEMLAQARADGAEVKVVRVELDETKPLAEQLKAAMDSVAEGEQPETATATASTEDKDEEDAVEVIAIAMFDEDGTPVSVDMVKYEDFLDLEETAVDAVESLEEAGEEIQKLQAQLVRFKQLRDAVGEFANKTFAAESGEAVRAGHFLSKEVLHKFPDLYK